MVVAGRRWGKTRLAVTAALFDALRGGTVWWIAPTFPISNIGWNLLKNLARQYPGAVIRESDRAIRFEDIGGMIAAKSADNPVSLRGEGLTLAILEESAFMPETIWTEEVAPSLTDRKGGAYFISTPHGLRNALAYAWKQAEHDPEWKRWHFTSYDNPFLDPKEIDKARENLPSFAFQQEYLAEFLEEGMSVAKREWFPIVDAYPVDCYRVRFWDLAASVPKKGSDPDFTVGTLMGVKDGIYYIIDVVRGRWGPGQVEAVIEQTAAVDGLRTSIGFEHEIGAGARLFFASLISRLAGYHVVHINPVGKKVERARPFLAQAEAGNVRLVNGPWVRDWLDEITMVPNSSHDDQFDSAAGAFLVLARMTKRKLFTW